MNYELCKQVMKEDTKRAGFNALAKQTFCLSFEEWYQNKEWGEWNQPYTLFDGEKAVANITVNQMTALYQGQLRHYIQLGGVMTDPVYRGQGLSRALMEEVIKDWKDYCDGMFLLANRSVTEFYPRFGFVEEKQYRCMYHKGISSKMNLDQGKVRRLDYFKKEDKELLTCCYEKHNPYSELQFIDNSSLLWFYCYDEDIRNSLYYIPSEDAVIIAECGENSLNVYDIYYDGNKSLSELLDIFCGGEVPETTLWFTPKDKQNIDVSEYIDEDTHLFVLEGKENIFRNAELYIPELSHT